MSVNMYLYKKVTLLIWIFRKRIVSVYMCLQKIKKTSIIFIYRNDVVSINMS